MGVPKVAGIETEYGIIILGANNYNPFLASQLVLNAYQQVGGPSIPMVYYHVQAKSSETKQETAETVSYSLSSLMLANGARYYIDHAHPEYCTPETLSARRVVAADKAGERIVARCLDAVNHNSILPDGQKVLIYKNNSDFKGNSYGCHENYLLSDDLFEDLLKHRSHIIYRYLLPFLISRVVICGAGKVGSENRTAPAPFQLSQRADFFETLMGIQTTHRRPLFNTRDEAHADETSLRRLHVILGDANMSEIATYLKIGTTQLVLHMLEDGFIKTDLTLAAPLHAFRQVSRDMSLAEPLLLEDGTLKTAADIQEAYLTMAEDYLTETGGSDEQWALWDRWAEMIDTIQAGNWQALATRLDWAIKRNLLERYLTSQATNWQQVCAWQPIFDTMISLGEHTADTLAVVKTLFAEADISWDDYPKQREVYYGLRRLDLEYHDIQRDTGLYYRLQDRGLLERLLDDSEIDSMIEGPPPDTRAWLRGKTVERFSASIVGADWSYLKLQPADSKTIYRLDLPDPLAGTEQELGRIWDQLRTPEQMFDYFRQHTP